ncbi:MAG: hypothetical protein ACOCVY_00190 [Patescibacteria group bacterium]
MEEETNKNQLPDSWLYSQSFLKRAFAVWGHYFVAQLLISIAIGIIMMFFLLLLSGSLMG